jgi:hypothetical protein
MVDGLSSLGPAEVLCRYEESAEAMAEVFTGLDDAAWAALAEAPPGHVPLSTVAGHALWDAWIHERDIALPLGIEPAEEPDEVSLCLAYVAGLGPSFAAGRGAGRRGSLAVEATHPDLRFVVDIGDDVVVRGAEADDGTPRLRGSAIDLVEGLSFRAPLRHELADAHRWLLGGLDEVFDQTA